MIRMISGLTALAVILAGPALAQPIVDGTIAGDSYDPAASVQAVETQFGDNLNELDAAYYASNQFLGPVQPPQGNLGSDGNGGFTGGLHFSLANFSGDQFFICTPQPVPVEPTTWSKVKFNYR